MPSEILWIMFLSFVSGVFLYAAFEEEVITLHMRYSHPKRDS